MFVEREKKEKKEAGDFERQLKFFFFFLVDEQKAVEDIINDFRCNHF